MNIKKGIDRISLILALIAIVPGFGAGWVFYLGVYEEQNNIWQCAIAGGGGGSLVFLIVLFGIRGITRVALWVVSGFREK